MRNCPRTHQLGISDRCGSVHIPRPVPSLPVVKIRFNPFALNANKQLSVLHECLHKQADKNAERMNVHMRQCTHVLQDDRLRSCALSSHHHHTRTADVGSKSGVIACMPA